MENIKRNIVMIISNKKDQKETITYNDLDEIDIVLGLHNKETINDEETDEIKTENQTIMKSNEELINELTNEFKYYLNLSIEDDNVMKIERFKDKKISSSFLAGFVDGDGHIYIHKQSKDDIKSIEHVESAGNIENFYQKQIYRCGLSIGQARTNILQIIKYFFGGSIYKSTEEVRIEKEENNKFKTDNIRQIYIYNVNSYFSEYILNYIYYSLVIKRKQVDTIYKFNYHKEICKYAENEDKNNILEDICQENMILHKMDNPADFDYDFDNINIEYIAGLFDAEGCISLVTPFGDKYHSPKISISQKKHVVVLERIIKFLGYGSIENNNSFTISGRKAYELMNCIINLTIVKYNQLYVVKKYYENRFIYKNELTNLFFVDFVRRILNKEKHEGENYIDEKDKNIDGFMKIVKDELVKKVDGKNVLKNQYEIKSEKMKGEGHFFFGKHFSESHKENLGKSISVSRRKNNKALTDENISYIFNRLKEKDITPKDIIEDFKKKNIDITHDIIRKIRNGKFQPSDSTTQIKKSAINVFIDSLEPNQKTSIRKRRINDFNTLIEIILWKKAIHASYIEERENNDNYKSILTWNIEKEREREREGEKKNLFDIHLLVNYLNEVLNYNITAMIIKTLWNGKSKLFREEFEYYNPEKLTYEEYQTIINK